MGHTVDGLMDKKPSRDTSYFYQFLNLCKGFTVGSSVLYPLRTSGVSIMISSSNRTFVFYQGDTLITVKQGDQHRTLFRTPDLPLAEQRVAGGESYGLFATDEKASVLSVQETDKGEHHAYSARPRPETTVITHITWFQWRSFRSRSGWLCARQRLSIIQPRHDAIHLA